MYRGNYIPIGSFKGGYCGNYSPSQLALNQAADLDNIVISPDGKGFRTRLGNTKLNSAPINSGANIQGLYRYILPNGANTSLMAVVGAKLYVVNTDTGNTADITGSITITAGADNQWDMLTFNDNAIGFGGSSATPDAPWVYTSSGNASALGGTPPSAYGAFTANNRVFAFRTAAGPSTIYWSTLANAADWTSAGSGSATVGSLNDNQAITAAKVLGTNYVLVFKQNSTYQMIISAAPFPIYTLFDNVGCVGKNAAVNIDGVVYFINAQKRMYSTDGEKLQEYPPAANDLWNNQQQTRLPFITGFRQRGADFDWLVWLTSTTGSTNNVALIWDLINKCWLKCSTGYKFNVVHTDPLSITWGGNYAGNIFQQGTAATYADASESSPGTIAGFWRTGWMNANIEKIEQIRRVTVEYDTRASGNITVNYGFDFVADSSSFTLSQVAAGSEVSANRFSALSGRGNYIQLKIGQSSSTIDSSINQILLGGKAYGQKRFTST